jgi:DHA1 family bicyclomycin/chloramphenicol resistance-like MFS transporter
VRPDGLRGRLVISALLAFGSISTDLYLPALPDIGRALHADAGAVELTVTGFLAGFSLGQLAWGPVSDRYGRWWPVAIGLVLFMLGSAGCALADAAWQMLLCRVLQATGACAGVVLGRAMVRDLFAGDRAAQVLSTLMMVMAIAPLLGPVIGGQVLALAGWRAIFWTLVGVGGATLAALCALPETLPAERRSGEPLGRALAAYGGLLRNRSLLGYAGAGGFFFCGTFAYIAGTPFAYIDFYHVPPRFYGLLFGLGIVGLLGTTLVNARVVMRTGTARMLRLGTGAAAVAGTVLGVTAWTGWGGLVGLVAPLFVFIGVTGFIIANSVAGALSLFPGRAGTVSALVGAIQYGSGMAGSALVAAFADGTPRPMGCVVALSGIGSAACAWLAVRGQAPLEESGQSVQHPPERAAGGNQHAEIRRIDVLHRLFHGARRAGPGAGGARL